MLLGESLIQIALDLFIELDLVFLQHKDFAILCAIFSHVGHVS